MLMLMMCWARRDTNENGRQVVFVLAVHHKMYLTTRRFGEKFITAATAGDHQSSVFGSGVKCATSRDSGLSNPSLRHVYTRLHVQIRQSRQNSDQSAASRLWELGVSWTPFSLDVSIFFLHQMTKLCTAEWSTRARQLYIKPFVHYQHSRVFPVYASRGDRDDVWRATVALNDPAALSQSKLTVQQMQTDVRLSADKWNFSFWIFFFFGGGGVFVRSIFTIRFFSLSLSGRGKKSSSWWRIGKGQNRGPSLVDD